MKISIPADVLFQEVAGEIVFLNMKSEAYFGLDQIGAKIWGYLQKGHSFDDVVALIVDEYQTSPDRVRDDIQKLLAELQDNGLIAIE